MCVLCTLFFNLFDSSFDLENFFFVIASLLNTCENDAYPLQPMQTKSGRYVIVVVVVTVDVVIVMLSMLSLLFLLLLL